MKVVVLHGQNHKGSTWNLTKLLLDKLNPQEVQEFYTNDLPACVGCFACIVKGEDMCPHHKAIQPIIQAVEQADVIIAESPTYCKGMSGQLKILFDHLAYRWMSHRPHPAMKNKVGIAISTTAGTGADCTTKSVAEQMFWWGVGKTYQIPFVVAAMSWKDIKPEKMAKITAKVDQVAAKVVKAVGNTSPGLKSKFIFSAMGMMQKKMPWNPVDESYWKEQGWI